MIVMNEPVRRTLRDEPAMFIGLVEIVAGVAAAIYIVAHGWTTSVVRSPAAITVENRLGGVSLLAGLYFLATAYAGRRLWKGDKIGYHLSAALLAAQVIHLYLPGKQFAISCPASLGPAWILDGDGAGPGFVSSYGLNLVISWERAIPASSVSINLIPFAAALYLLFAARRVARDELAISAPVGSIAGE
jgi:hypothetical protein